MTQEMTEANEDSKQTRRARAVGKKKERGRLRSKLLTKAVFTIDGAVLCRREEEVLG
jgi:hypothetical protein